MIDAWNSDDGVKAAALCTEDCTWHDVPIGRRHKGRAQIAESFTVMPGFSSDSHFAIEHAFCDDDNYAIQWRWAATRNSNGKPFDILGVSVGQRQVGLVALNTDYWNMQQLLEQIGPLQ
jgi:steroid delta-isomerase-like uncharacterized protein